MKGATDMDGSNYGFCTACGGKLPEGGFCPACGALVNAGQNNAQCAASPTGEVTLYGDGVYRWVYELNMFKNPTVFFTVLKILLGCAAGVFLLVFFLSMGDNNFWFDGLLSLCQGFSIAIGIMLGLCILGYAVIAAVMGGKYCVLFEMDEQGIKHIQLPKQYKKAQVLASLTMLAGALTNNATAMGAGMLAGANQSMSSQWNLVKSVKCNPRTRAIKVNQPLAKNQVYAQKADYDFVREYIVSRCRDAKIKG